MYLLHPNFPYSVLFHLLPCACATFPLHLQLFLATYRCLKFSLVYVQPFPLLLLSAYGWMHLQLSYLL
jgi:hypothetical protein